MLWKDIEERLSLLCIGLLLNIWKFKELVVNCLVIFINILGFFFIESWLIKLIFKLFLYLGFNVWLVLGIEMKFLSILVL